MNLVLLAGPRNLDRTDSLWEVIGFRRSVKYLSLVPLGTRGFVLMNSNEDMIFVPEIKGTYSCDAGSLYLKILTDNEEETKMGKRIGNFTNPTTGEEDWFEPNTVSMVMLQPKMVTRVGEVNQSAIDFKLDASPDENHILLTAEYSVNGTKYTSNPVTTSSEDFANEFATIVYTDKALDECDLIKRAKDQACQDLTRRLMDNGILMGGMQFAGFGFVFVEEDKVMTLDIIDFEYNVVSGNAVRKATIRNCVSQASLANLDNPQIRLWTGTHRIELVNPVVNMEESTEGRIKEYSLTITDLVVVPDTTMPEHATYDKINFNDESFLDAYIEERKSLLADLSGSEDNLDDLMDIL